MSRRKQSEVKMITTLEQGEAGCTAEDVARENGSASTRSARGKP